MPVVSTGRVAVLLALFAVPGEAQESPRFSHAQHTDQTCASCHPMTAANRWTAPFPVASGKKGHEPCSSCHQHEAMYRPPFPAKEVRLKFCGTCHGAEGTDFSKAKYPPYRERGASDFWLATFEHGKHAALRGCDTCHGTSTRAPGKHAGCSDRACHGGNAKPVMDACSGCHTVKKGPIITRAWSDFRTRDAFTHGKHAQVSKQNDCARCHGDTAAPAGAPVPLPKMIQCESCHDGKAAFHALGTGCRKCHQVRDPVPVAATSPRVAFAHAQHETAKRCESCHSSTPEGVVSHAGDDHRLCSGCHEHEKEFRSAGSPVCLACHEHSDPFRPNAVRVEPRANSEFTVGIGHDSHKGASCESCHREKPARAHALCATCHAAGKAPRMTHCDGCHATPGAEPQGPWRVSAKFSHDTHRTDVRNKSALPCVACHAGVTTASAGHPVPRPTMRGCADCHQGTAAFKTTGTSCAKCHGPVVRG